MHIPDGFLDGKTVAATAVLAGTGLAISLRHAQRAIQPKKAPLMGLSAAFIFAAQMVNFPVAPGTSGHLMGSVLAAVLLGPSAAVIVITTVLVVQCFLFADGGLLAMGANIFNMALVAVLGGWGVFRLMQSRWQSPRSLILAATFGAWCSIVLAACSCAGQLAMSGSVQWQTAFPAMLHIHMLIGLGEGLITGLVLSAILRVRPELVLSPQPSSAPKCVLEGLGLGLVVATGIVLFVAPFASSYPDGLEWVAHRLGFDDKEVAMPATPPPMPDYQIPGVSSDLWSTALAGLAGTLVAFGLALLLAHWLIPRVRNKQSPS